ncbi:hypothetical protein PLESTB_000693100 [Pleodorina starrii]|uniref:Major facilitator superfamily (MFS) profile domain-containing protein n=1 Tax=Pleodorina starrii TaxID=330485 RepID=A0A9W6BIR2_9CHLO|nr:hypothetical protein PLESTM_001224100 [Pleodorina starrii]GLC52961.1 hypothetical protein PLESTB_000693100 [Pleodorina starrii]GLC65257.1 hypothetical protein PLESTF_000269400 [Pleodorina starrii]
MLVSLPLPRFNPVTMTVEEALSHVGTGPFQWTVLCVCGLANAADAVEILSVGLLGAAAEQDLNLTDKRTGALNACIFVGMFLGGLSWGLLGDVVGRKRALLVALAVNAVFGALSAASTSLWQLMALRLMAGLGVGGSMPVVFSLMSEFCPPSSRGKFMAMLASFWMVGSLYSASMGWLLIPLAGWRVFVLVASLPAALCCCLMQALVPESPRYLTIMGRGREAGQVLQRIARANGTHLPDDFALPSFHHRDQDILTHKTAFRTDADGHPHADALAAPPLPYTSGGALRRLRRGAAEATERTVGVLTALLSPPLASYTLPLAVAWIGLCGGWYCTLLWVPVYFKRRGAVETSVYAETFAVSLANLPGNLASIWLVDRLGRRKTACVCMAGACVCALLFAAAPAQGGWPLAAACVFNGVSVGGWNSLDMISAELYPTSLRSSGFGLLNALGRVSSFATTYAAGALLQSALWAPLLLAAVLLAAGSAAMLHLPEPAGKPLEDSFCQEDKEQEGLLSGSLSGSAGSSRHGTRGGGGGGGGAAVHSHDEEDRATAGGGRDGGGGGGVKELAAERVALLAAAGGRGSRG